MINQKLWGGRFTQATNKLVEDFTASISFDHQLAEFDIIGSLAHAKMLEKCAILSKDDTKKIVAGLKNIYKKILASETHFSIDDEDIHMHIEKILHQEIGAIAGKLHTARSRNDQVTLDVHLYLRAQVLSIMQFLLELQQTLLAKATQHIDIIMPGYTHLQRAQPILFSHHLLAYCAMLQRDIERFSNSWARINQMPLGAGALAGTTFAIDRQYVAQLLSFDSVYENSMDAVSDRDFILEFLANASIVMTHLSRLSEELILWSTQEFGFIELADAYCTGSSMMPQKKNPDVPELVRGKTGRVYGALMNLLTIMKSLPLSYNKDLQEDKEPLFDTVKTLQQALAVMIPTIDTMQINQHRMQQATAQGFLNATDLADYLAQKGVPFRQAHEIVGQIVHHCLQEKISLEQLPIMLMKKYSDLITEDVYPLLEIKSTVNARKSYGGTAAEQVNQQIETYKKKTSETHRWLEDKQACLEKIQGLID